MSRLEIRNTDSAARQALEPAEGHFLQPSAEWWDDAAREAIERPNMNRRTFIAAAIAVALTGETHKPDPPELTDAELMEWAEYLAENESRANRVGGEWRDDPASTSWRDHQYSRTGPDLFYGFAGRPDVAESLRSECLSRQMAGREIIALSVSSDGRAFVGFVR